MRIKSFPPVVSLCRYTRPLQIYPSLERVSRIKGGVIGPGESVQLLASYKCGHFHEVDKGLTPLSQRY